MKTKTTLAITAFAMIAALSLPAHAVTDQVQHNVGLVDMTRLVDASDAGKDILKVVQSKSKEFEAQVKREEDALRSASQELFKQKDTLSREEFEKRYRALDQKNLEGQKMVKEKRTTLNLALAKARGELRTEAAKVIADLAKEKELVKKAKNDAVFFGELFELRLGAFP